MKNRTDSFLLLLRALMRTQGKYFNWSVHHADAGVPDLNFHSSLGSGGEQKGRGNRQNLQQNIFQNDEFPGEFHKGSFIEKDIAKSSAMYIQEFPYMLYKACADRSLPEGGKYCLYATVCTNVTVQLYCSVINVAYVCMPRMLCTDKDCYAGFGQPGRHDIGLQSNFTGPSGPMGSMGECGPHDDLARFTHS